MNPTTSLIASLWAAAAPAAAPPDQAIIVTAARDPVPQQEATVSSTLLLNEEIELFGLPQATDLLRLIPGTSVAVSGPPGSQAQVRIRGAEANHSLLFVDGIRFNDPAAGNEARFELLTTDPLARIEIVRGPQSALWGSEALGGVIAVQSATGTEDDRLTAMAEYGSFDSSRLSGSYAAKYGDLAVSGSGGWLRSDGMDAFGGDGERDGFDNRSASLKAIYAPSSSSEFGVVGHWLHGKSEYDGFDPATFQRADTLDETSNRIAAARLWGRLGWGARDNWSLSFGAGLLDSANRNRLGDEELNRTAGRRATFDAQLATNLHFAGAEHRLTVAAEHQDEDFTAGDQQYFGATDQDRSRTVTSAAGAWRTQWGKALITDLSLRHDRFSAFADATTFRASLLLRLAPQWSVHGAYGEGIAQPTFYDLHGFFPGFFVGNPALRPEHSRGWEAGARWTSGSSSVGITGFTARLRDEIVDIFDPETFLSSTANSEGKSHRRGIELDARHRLKGGGLLSFNYTLLDAEQEQTIGNAMIREVRRPRHSANAIAAIPLGPLNLGAGLAYVGKRTDTNFDSFPARDVTLDDYLLGSLSLGWKVSRQIEVYGRMENAFGADYEDVFGYETPGRTIYAGLRLRLGD